jgi:hypothetical protein
MNAAETGDPFVGNSIEKKESVKMVNPLNPAVHGHPAV